MMKNILFLICALSFFTAGIVSAAHAHDGEQSTDQKIEISIEYDSSNSSDMTDTLCDIHTHNHMTSIDVMQTTYINQGTKVLSLSSENAVYSLIYGLKRPPRA